MSLYDCIYRQGYEWKIDSNYEYTGLLEVLNELQSTGNLMLTATKVMELCKNAGVIVTDNDVVWKQVSGLTDRIYSSAGGSKLFYVWQKKLIVEMIMELLALDAQTVTDLEYVCAGAVQCASGYHYKPQQAEDVS